MNPITDGIQPSLKLWGEEEIDDAVYAIYLKKVRYHHARTDSLEQVSHLEWETVRIKTIKAGTLEKLVESFVSETGEMESTYMNIFFSTYRSFASPSQVLCTLLNRYEQVDNDPNLSFEARELHKKTLERVLLVWLDMYPEDFYEPPQFLNLIKIKEFADKYASGTSFELRLKHKILKYHKKEYLDSTKVSTNVCNCLMQNFPPSKYSTMFDISSKDFAQQLTYSDNELFRRLVPYQCLGSAWSQRDKVGEWSVSPHSVTATVNQFNAVSLRVISTILSDITLKPFSRGKIIEKWIDIAQELRLLKNFSSLKAITAALQSNSIHRLTKSWLSVSREKIIVFSELAKIFSEENNQTNCRELLMKEGSAKFVNTDYLNNKICCKGSEKIFDASTMQGTIPYLGTFLTDLTMIDTAIQDRLPNGFINFEKKRKEFEILAQIKLLKSAANSYDIYLDADFQSWFKSIAIYGEKESYELSCLIDNQDNMQTKKNSFESMKSSVFKWSHQKSDSYSSSSSNSALCDKFSKDINGISLSGDSYSKLSKSCSNLSLSLQSNGTALPESNFYVIKVSLDQKNCDGTGMIVYKSILLSNNDHTRTVITNAMSKHGIAGSPDDYFLVQLVPDGEIVFPDSANVYYATYRGHEFNFVLRAKYENSSNQKRKGR